MNAQNKDELIVIRIQKDQKEDWKKLYTNRKISMTSLIIDSDENRILDDERRKVIAFIEKQDNLYIKIETNINQTAGIVNVQKLISKNELQKFSQHMEELKNLKIKQNEMLKKICQLLGTWL